jgi:hypothetical protein
MSSGGRDVDGQSRDASVTIDARGNPVLVWATTAGSTDVFACYDDSYQQMSEE